MASAVTAVTPFGGGSAVDPVPPPRWGHRPRRPAIGDSEQALGPHHADALEMLSGELLTHPSQNVAEGLACARAALKIRERLDPPESPRVAGALEGLAMWLWHADELEEMLPIVERAFAIRRKATPRDD